MQDYSQASAYIAALTSNADTAVAFRMIHDTDAGVPAIPFTGRLRDSWSTILAYQAQGYGAFVEINVLSGGRELSHVQSIRAHVLDLDSLNAPVDYAAAAAFQPAPSFAVQSSPQKFHVYWCVSPYRDNDRYTVVQRKLRQTFQGDKAVIDPTRVLRMPGTLHLKNPAAPHLVSCWSLPGYGIGTTVEALEATLAHVNVVDGGGGRHELGDPALAAPSLDWVKTALKLVDPNNLDRGEWLAISAALKQSVWSHVTPDEAYALWSEWCAGYEKNDVPENLKAWNSFRNTELGWPSLVSRIPSLKAMVTFSGQDRSAELPSPPGGPVVPSSAPPMPTPPPLDCSGEILTHLEQQEFFKGCVAIERAGEIMVPSGRFMNASKFNMRYGGKQFIFTGSGKLTDEAWKAATRSTLWTVPKVDHTRFLPDQPFGAIIRDQLGRPGVNTYIPVAIRSVPGDITPFTQHMELMLPNENDRNILYMYLAHNVKFPGVKIKWAPMVQSTEGVGKGFLMEAMETIIGEMYCYSPKAQELVKSGSTFNAWMRAKLMIIVNEIKVDERRELIEILKPMISDKRVEIQSKGIDQEMEDNPANWIFFSNFKDAIPVAANGRRYAIFYSAIQSAYDLVARGMDDAYFNKLFAWLRADGAAIIAHWLMQHPVTVDTMPGRAPDTSSMAEAKLISRGPLERMIADAIEDALPGFKGGWVSSVAVTKRAKETGAVTRNIGALTLENIMSAMGYVACGRSTRPYFQEDKDVRATLYYQGRAADVSWYGRMQGWE